MTITSVGFNGSVDDKAFSIKSRFDGSTFPSVGGQTDFSLSNGSAARSINLAPGSAVAYGIQAVSDAVATVTLADVTTAGQSRWDAVCLRYDWNAKSVTPVVVAGSAATNAPAVLPPGLNNTVGTLYDHVLGLAQIVQGQTTVQQFLSKRLWSHKRTVAASKDGLPPALPLYYGAEIVLVDGTGFRCILDSSNNLAWVQQSTNDVSELSGADVVSASTGWLITDANLNKRCLVGPHWRQLDLDFRRTGDTINAADDDGNFRDTLVGQLTAACRPDVMIATDVSYWNGGFELSGRVRIETNGNVTLLAGVPGNNLTKNSATSGGSNGVDNVSLRLNLMFGKRAA